MSMNPIGAGTGKDMIKNYLYTFYIDGDVYSDITYRKYCETPKINKAVMDNDRRRLFLGLTVHSYSQDYLDAHKDVRDMFNEIQMDQRLNRLKYFAPNTTEQLEFLNDVDNDVVALVAPNRIGKTTCGVVKMLTSGIIPLNPMWPIFTKHGVKYTPFRETDKEIKFGLGSYEWSHIRTVVWPRVKEYVPDALLGMYGREGAAKARGKPRRDPNFDRTPLVELGCGTILKFHAYSQSQANYESDAYNGFLYDEQPPEMIFNAVDERTRTLRGKHFFTLTPHKVDGRADTGGGGWLQKFLTGKERKGHQISCYNTSLTDVPDWIYPETEKRKAIEKWIDEPARLRNIKTLREGKARILGQWHETSGLVIDEWDKLLHIIDDFPIPESWTLYRGLDHGITNPTACLWAAVSPPKGEWGSDVIIYREFYSQGKTVTENVMSVITNSGNTRRNTGSMNNMRADMVTTLFEEVQSREYYAKTVLDSRSFALNDPGSGKTYGQIYKASGLPVSPASGKKSEHWVPLLKELFAPNYDADHVYNKKSNGEFVKGRPHLMIFRSCVNLIREIEGWVWEEYRSGADGKNLKESPRKLNDHGCTALGYLCQIPLRFRGDLYGRMSSVGNAFQNEQEEEGYRGV